MDASKKNNDAKMIKENFALAHTKYASKAENYELTMVSDTKTKYHYIGFIHASKNSKIISPV